MKRQQTLVCTTNFTAAAYFLGYTKNHISLSIKRLEVELTTALVLRTTHRVSLPKRASASPCMPQRCARCCNI
ncbi:helix-turn-helix domain-containing protein [Iodobacter fluviatilis]|uniref:HTH lysR-type domain-containing protein n=1 Tax=Iodobacter fluviatilis TaxID=537 RepID=A0A7G3GAM0_9NEIS|nr:hypothetical protein C1H71_12610 [Iodobacter fluviatilis]